MPINDGSSGSNRIERIRINNVTEDLLVVVVGSGSFTRDLAWGNIPAPAIQPDTPTDITTLGLNNTSQVTQSSTRTTLMSLNNALAKVSGYRAQYGTWNNCF